jgi:hypothetical protein
MDRIKERELIDALPRERLADFIFMHLRNLWTVDGLYFLNIEDQWGTEKATEVDRRVWEVMGKIEARRLKNLLQITGSDVASMMKALLLSGWALDLEDKDVEVGEKRGIIRVTQCRVQTTRIAKGLGEFPCKSVRWGFLQSFAREFNPDIVVHCRLCPPDDHAENLWCEWEFYY